MKDEKKKNKKTKQTKKLKKKQIESDVVAFNEMAWCTIMELADQQNANSMI